MKMRIYSLGDQSRRLYSGPAEVNGKPVDIHDYVAATLPSEIRVDRSGGDQETSTCYSRSPLFPDMYVLDSVEVVPMEATDDIGSLVDESHQLLLFEDRKAA